MKCRNALNGLFLLTKGLSPSIKSLSESIPRKEVLIVQGLKKVSLLFWIGWQHEANEILVEMLVSTLQL